MTSKDLKCPQKNPLQLLKWLGLNTSKKNKLKGGYLNENIEIDGTNLDEIMKTNNLDRLKRTSKGK